MLDQSGVAVSAWDRLAELGARLSKMVGLLMCNVHTNLHINWGPQKGCESMWEADGSIPQKMDGLIRAGVNT